MKNQNLKTSQKKRVILFVHGLNGSLSSWKGKPINYYERFTENDKLIKNYDIDIFEYRTKIFELRWWQIIKSFVPNKERRDKFNGSIRDIGLQLRSYIKENLISYESIVLITHSMGGLVAKKAISEMNQDEVGRIHLYVSLSVPHNGAKLANIGKALLGRKNPQLINLKMFSDFTTELSRDYSRVDNSPKAIYQRGYNDKVVVEGSAIPESALEENIIDTDDDHFSSREVDNPEKNIIYKRLVRELLYLIPLGTYGKIINVPISFSIPPNWSFKEVAITLSKSVEASISFEGFTDSELDIPLRSQTLAHQNVYESLKSLRDIGLKQIPSYDITIDYSRIKIEKNN